MVKRAFGVHFLRNFGEIFKNKDFGFDMFKEGQILKPFQASPSKLKLKKKIMVLYVHIEYSPNNFQKNRSWDGILPPPWSLW